MNSVIAFLNQHWEALSAVGVFVFMALISTMPKPGTWTGGATLYAWLYSFCQELLSLRSSKLSAGAEPQVNVSVPQSAVTTEEAPKTEVTK